MSALAPLHCCIWPPLTIVGAEQRHSNKTFNSGRWTKESTRVTTQRIFHRFRNGRKVGSPKESTLHAALDVKGCKGWRTSRTVGTGRNRVWSFFCCFDDLIERLESGLVTLYWTKQQMCKTYLGDTTSTLRMKGT